MSSLTADLASQPPRPGTQGWDAIPSRIGNHLHYRDGRITDMQGRILHPPRNPNADYRPTHDGRTRARPAFSAD